MKKDNSLGITIRNLSAHEAGGITFWAMLICVVSISVYLKVGREYLGANLALVYHLIVLATLVIITVFTLGCSIHMIISGDKSSRELRRDIKKQVRILHEFVAQAEQRIAAMETELKVYTASIRPRGIESLQLAKRIVAAISRRAADVEALLAKRWQVYLIDGHELLCEDLSVIEDCVDGLIIADPIPPLPPQTWFSTVNRLLEAVDMELDRIAA